MEGKEPRVKKQATLSLSQGERMEVRMRVVTRAMQKRGLTSDLFLEVGLADLRHVRDRVLSHGSRPLRSGDLSPWFSVFHSILCQSSGKCPF